jgi:hypothetical protein
MSRGFPSHSAQYLDKASNQHGLSVDSAGYMSGSDYPRSVILIVRIFDLSFAFYVENGVR